MPSCHAVGNSRASPSCQLVLCPQEGTPWGLTRHKGEVDSAGKTLSFCLQPPDGLKVPAGRRWYLGITEERGWYALSHSRRGGSLSHGEPGDGGILSCITQRHPHAMPTQRAFHSLDGNTLHVLGTPGKDVAL